MLLVLCTYIYTDEQRGPLLDWERRLHIIEGIAQGLLFITIICQVSVLLCVLLLRRIISRCVHKLLSDNPPR
jgi:hypothetical protein